MANTARKAAEQSLAEYLGTTLPLPWAAQQSLDWALDEREDAKLKLIEQLDNSLFNNRYESQELVIAEALANFNVTEKS